MHQYLFVLSCLWLAGCDKPLPVDQDLAIREFTRCVTEGGEFMPYPVAGIHGCRDRFDLKWDGARPKDCKRNGKPVACSELPLLLPNDPVAPRTSPRDSTSAL